MLTHPLPCARRSTRPKVDWSPHLPPQGSACPGRRRALGVPVLSAPLLSSPLSWDPVISCPMLPRVRSHRESTGLPSGVGLGDQQGLAGLDALHVLRDVSAPKALEASVPDQLSDAVPTPMSWVRKPPEGLPLPPLLLVPSPGLDPSLKPRRFLSSDHAWECLLRS